MNGRDLISLEKGLYQKSKERDKTRLLDRHFRMMGGGRVNAMEGKRRGICGREQQRHPGEISMIGRSRKEE